MEHVECEAGAGFCVRPAGRLGSLARCGRRGNRVLWGQGDVHRFMSREGRRRRGGEEERKRERGEQESRRRRTKRPQMNKRTPASAARPCPPMSAPCPPLPLPTRDAGRAGLGRAGVQASKQQSSIDIPQGAQQHRNGQSMTLL